MRFVVLFLTVFITSCVSNMTSDSALSNGQIAFYEHDGYRIVCYSAELQGCGLKLTNCDTGMIYSCAQNVMIFDSEVFQESLLKNFQSE